MVGGGAFGGVGRSMHCAAVRVGVGGCTAKTARTIICVYTRT